MSYVLIINQTPVNVPDIQGDLYFQEDGSGTPSLFPSSLVGQPYVLDLNLFLYQDLGTGGDDGPVLEPEPITSVLSETPDNTGVTFTVLDPDPLNYQIRVSGTISAQFASTYSFVTNEILPDGSFKLIENVSTSSNLPEYIALFRWIPSTVIFFFYSLAFSFTVNQGAASEATESFGQYVYYDWNSGISQFRTVLAGGSI
jgi:hypothetical protein